jgi:hypothetical protein
MFRERGGLIFEEREQPSAGGIRTGDSGMGTEGWRIGAAYVHRDHPVPVS